MTLFAAWSEIVADWAPSFPQPRTFRRAARQALGSLICVGRRCLSRIIWAQGRQQRSWSSEYFLHSRCRWEPQTLFAGVWRRALPYCPGRLVGVAVDDTRLRWLAQTCHQCRVSNVSALGTAQTPTSTESAPAMRCRACPTLVPRWRSAERLSLLGNYRIRRYVKSICVEAFTLILFDNQDRH